MTKKAIKTVNVSSLDVDELACKILGLDYDEIDADPFIIEKELYEQLNIDLEIFTKLLQRLVPLVEKAKSELSGEIFKGFADIENRFWLLKITEK